MLVESSSSVVMLLEKKEREEKGSREERLFSFVWRDKTTQVSTNADTSVFHDFLSSPS